MIPGITLSVRSIIVSSVLTCIAHASLAGPSLPNCPKYSRDDSFAYTDTTPPTNATAVPNPDLTRGVQATCATIIIDNKAEDAGERRNFSVMFGGATIDEATNTSTDLGKGKLEDEGEDWSDPVWFVQSGFALARGWRPRIRTTIVSMVPESTSFIVRVLSQQIENDVVIAEVDQITLLEGGPLEVSTLDKSIVKNLTEPFTYIKATLHNDVIVISDPIALPADKNEDEQNGKPRKFVSDVLGLPLVSMPD